MNKNLIISDDSPVYFKEAFKDFRTNLSYSLPKGKKLQNILITSCEEMDGKYVVSLNLAISLAQNNSRVLLIECNNKSLETKKYFKIGNNLGLSDYLCTDAKAAQITNKTNINNLSVILSGKYLNNLFELFQTEKMIDLVESNNQNFDYIIYYTESMQKNIDSISLANYVDGAILVVKDRITTHSKLQKAIATIEKSNIKILGLVLNYSKGKKSEYYY